MVKEQIKCPVCGMDVHEKSEYKAEHEGETYYFCSEEEFQAHPPKYLLWLDRWAGGWNECSRS